MLKRYFHRYKVELTGITAWLLFSFAAIRLSLIYISHSGYAWLIAFNACAIAFLFYFFAYYREQFHVSRMILLLVIYFAGMHLADFFYRLFIYLEPGFGDMPALIAVSGISLVLSGLLGCGIIRALIARKR